MRRCNTAAVTLTPFRLRLCSGYRAAALRLLALRGRWADTRFLLAGLAGLGAALRLREVAR
ncbi:hypothetical protein, partial [Xanthomonas sacchari]|uniref:hypothetical protein n=1 Tax=Xanthomonas sacchari TaxID=56458 RepID=UPI002256FF68